jgi:hypothetical protein
MGLDSRFDCNRAPKHRLAHDIKLACGTVFLRSHLGFGAMGCTYLEPHFKPLLATPAMNCFCASKNTTMIGKITMTDAAIN